MSLADCLRTLPAERLGTIAERIERFDAGQMSVNGMVMLVDDLLMSGALYYLPPKFTRAAVHCATMGMCYYSGRMLQ